VLIVGCEPATVEKGIGLSAPVAEAVAAAVEAVRDLISQAQAQQQPSRA
jgi:hydrogenase maturation protease